MEWIEAKLYTTNEGIEPVTAMLMDAGIGGIQIEDDEDLKLFLETNQDQWDYVDESLLQKENEETCITFYVSNNKFGNETILAVKNGIVQLQNVEIGLNLGRLHLELVNVDDESWLNEWKKYYKPFVIGNNVVIKPVWEPFTPAEGQVVFNINPGHVFGTGLHQTTQLCIIELEKYVKETTKVLDLGCGSGILSIVSLLLLAESAFAVDIDPNAVDIAYENAELNGLDKSKYTVVSGNMLADEALADQIKQTEYDIVVANIVADVIVAISSFVPTCLKKGGLFITSGIIKERLDDVYRALNENNFTIKDTLTKDDWVCVVAERQ